MNDTVGAIAANDESAGQDWFSLIDLIALGLPGLPTDRRQLARRARDESWDRKQDSFGEPLARRRAGQRGGGYEYHFSVLPGTAQLELAARGVLLTRPQPAEAETPGSLKWEWYGRQSQKVKDEAGRRMAIIAEMEILESAGLTRSAAVSEICRVHHVKSSTLWEWIKRIRGVSAHDRLPFLAPHRKGGGAEAEIPDDLWTLFCSDFLRPEQPTLASCYDRTKAIAEKQGVTLPSEAAFRRRIKRDIDARVQLLRRGKKDEFKRSIPDNRRTLEGSHALELVNVDGHVFDVWVTPSDGGKPVRPMLIAIQDVYSRKMLAWRLDLSENFLGTRLAFADLFRNFGIPKECLLDNSRTFAGKALTGGAKTRYRNKVIEGEAYGLLTSLGIRIRFAQVYHGQAKPIERAFRDLADRIARGPRCAGAYAGNSVANKPTNVGERAVPWDDFVRIVDDGIAEHNAREGRRGGVCNGRSFDQVFAESYAVSQITKAGPEQLRIALLAAEQKRINSRTGVIELLGNRYWSPEFGKIRGQKVTVRYDPDNLLEPVHVYALTGEYLSSASIEEDYRFTDAAGAHAARKRRRDYTRAVKDAEAALNLCTAAEVAAMQVGTEAPDLPDPGVVQIARHRNVVAAQKAAPRAAPKNEQSKVLAGLEKAMLRLVE